MLVPEITPNSSIHDLTLSVFYSFQETERKMVEDILLNRDKDLREQLRISKDVLQKMLKEEGSFASLVKEKVESLMKSRVEFEEKMKAESGVLEHEVGSLREKCVLLEKMVHLASVEKRVLEDERDVVERKRQCENQKLRSDHDSMNKKLSSFLKENFQLREEMRKGVMQKEEARKEMEGEVENVRIKYEKELERERDSAALVKKEVEEKMKEKCHVVEQEGELKRRILEEEVESLRTQLEMLDNQNDVLQKGFKKELEKMRDCHNEELERIHDLMNKRLSVGVFEKLELEKELEKSRMLNEESRKEMEAELEKVRDQYEKELERERDSATVVKREFQKLMQSRVEFEEKMKEKCHALEQEGELKRRISEGEVESLRIQLEMLENQNDVLQKGFKKELEKMRECHNEELERIHDLMKRKLSVGVLEKLELQKELEKSRMLNEEARKELEGELEKARETYEKELERERDSSENKLIFANLEKMNLEEELSKSRMYLEERIQVLEEENIELNKTLELHKESFGNIRDLADQIKGISDSVISGHVMANGVSSYGSTAEKASHVEGRLIEYPVSSGEPLSGIPLQAKIEVFQGKRTGIQLEEKSGCPFLVNELKNGANNNSNLRLKCKRKRSTNESEDEGIDHCSGYSRVDSVVVSSENNEVASSQTAKEFTWRQSADMLSELQNNPELCMASVTALYRQHISAGNPNNKGVLSWIDIVSAIPVAKYLVNNDPENKLSRSLLEVQQDCPYVLKACFELANQYKEQIYEIYQKKLDPLFCVRP